MYRGRLGELCFFKVASDASEIVAVLESCVCARQWPGHYVDVPESELSG